MPNRDYTPAQAERSTQNFTSEDYRRIMGLLRDLPVLTKLELERCPRRGGHKFSLTSLVGIALYMNVNRKGYKGVKIDLDERPEMLKILGVEPRGGRYTCPSVGTMNNFINKVWPKIADAVEETMRGMFMKDCEHAFYTCDSTPLEASRYSRKWDYSPHYEIHMAKMHILMMNGHPMWYTVTNANDGDNPELLKMLEVAGPLHRNTVGFATDGGYASFKTYTFVHRLTGVVMASNPGSAAVLHDEITWKRLVTRYGRLWKTPGYKPAKYVNRRFILNFLMKNGFDEEVGMFLRNVDMRRGRMSSAEKQNFRHVCEEVHKAAKRWMPLDVRGLRVKTCMSILSFRFFLMQLFSYIFPEYR